MLLVKTYDGCKYEPSIFDKMCKYLEECRVAPEPTDYLDLRHYDQPFRKLAASLMLLGWPVVELSGLSGFM